MNNLLKNTIYYSVGEICPRIISFVLLPVYTHYLTTSDYGIFSYTNTVMLFFYVLASFALNSFVLRYYFVWTSEEERRKLIGSVASFIFISNAIILALTFVFLPTIISKYEIQIPWNPYFRLAVIANFLDSFSIIPLVIYRVRQDALTFVKLNLGKTMLLVVLNLYYIVYLEVGVIGHYYAMLWAYSIFGIIYIAIIYQYGVCRIKMSIIKEGLRFSLPLLPGALSYLILTVSDRIILERNVSIGSIGIYNVAFTLALALNIIIQSGYKAIEPELFKRYGTLTFYSFIKRIQSIFFMAIYVFGLIISLFSQEIFYYFTSPGFYEGYRLVPVLIVGVVMTGQNVIYSGILAADKRTKVIGIATILGAICSLLFNILLIPKWGIYAAAISSALSLTIMNIFLFVKMHFVGKTIHRESFSVLGIILMAYGIFYVCPEISLNGFLVKCVAVIVYSVVLYSLFGFKIQEVKELMLNLKR